MWGEPLVGFADGDDNLFSDYKHIVGEHHLTPREILTHQVRTAACGYDRSLEHVSIIAWVLPITCQTGRSMKKEDRFSVKGMEPLPMVRARRCLIPGKLAV